MYDVIVIGVGAMGSAACAHTARRGARVLGLDAFGIPNARGSSAGSTRVFRMCYYEHPSYVPLLQRARTMWIDLQRTAGRPLYDEIGGVYMGAADSAFITGSLEAARRYDLPHEALDETQLAARFPQFRTPRGAVGVYEPCAGILRPEAIVAAYADQAMTHGAELHGHEPVRAWDASDHAVTVHTDQQTYRARRLIITAGAWTNDLLVRWDGSPRFSLTVTRQTFGWFAARRRERFTHDVFPIWGMDEGPGQFFYGFPVMSDRPGVKIARHVPGEMTTPHVIQRTIGPDDRAALVEAIERILPDAAGPLLSASVCMYTVTPDLHFLIDTHPEHDHVSLATGFSGHGFKFACVVGQVLADLALDGGTELPIDFLRAARFSDRKSR